MHIELDQVEPFEIVPGYRARIVHSDSMTVAYVDIDAGAEIPEHSHVHEQIVNLLEGEFVLTVDGKPLRLVPGHVVIIPSNVPHSGKATSDCTILDVFHPVREDFLNRKVDYGTTNSRR